MDDSPYVKLITLEPAHFHAALVQKQMLPGIATRVAIYAPLGPDLLAHLKLIEQFNTRPDNPTHWELDIHCSSRPLEEMLAARPGNVVVLAGHNRTKIGKIEASLRAGLNVLSDKPWIIRAEDFPALESALSMAGEKRPGGLRYDDRAPRNHHDPSARTRERPGRLRRASFPPTAINRAFSWKAPITFSRRWPARPACVRCISLTFRIKGKGLTDVGTHLVDLVQWTLFPDQALNYRQDIQVQGRQALGHRDLRGAISRRLPARRRFPPSLPLTFTETNSTTTATIRWITKFGAPKCG